MHVNLFLIYNSFSSRLASSSSFSSHYARYSSIHSLSHRITFQVMWADLLGLMSFIKKGSNGEKRVRTTLMAAYSWKNKIESTYIEYPWTVLLQVSLKYYDSIIDCHQFFVELFGLLSDNIQTIKNNCSLYCTRLIPKNLILDHQQTEKLGRDVYIVR